MVVIELEIKFNCGTRVCVHACIGSTDWCWAVTAVGVIYINLFEPMFDRLASPTCPPHWM